VRRSRPQRSPNSGRVAEWPDEWDDSLVVGGL